jgi:diguanylate cyclase (GGDEF)-like protein
MELYKALLKKVSSVDRKNHLHRMFRYLLYISAVVTFILSSAKMNMGDFESIFTVFTFIPATIIIGTMVISLPGRVDIQLTDAIAAFIFMLYGSEILVFFTGVYSVVLMFINEKFISRREDYSKMFFNISMFIVAAYLSAQLINIIPKFYSVHSLLGHTVVSIGFIGLFLLVNIFIIKIDMSLEIKKNYKFDSESLFFLGINFIISSLVAMTLAEINSTSGTIGTMLVLGNLLVLHYCFHIYRKFKIRNVAIKGLLKVTGDVVKYGEFREKCKHLITNLKELIPYSVCAIYTFDINNDGIVYPIAYDVPEGMGIGDIFIDLSSQAITIKTIKNGKIYVSKDTKKDKNVKFEGKIGGVVESAILVPVLIEEKMVGAIFIGGDKTLVNFTANGIDDILHILSNQMALAIENDGIYRDMKNKADVDPLTRLYNRRVFDREVQNLIGSNTQFSLVIYDIDDFKKVNDGYGHLAGDEVLKMISDVVRKSIRKTDVPCRYGGEEIVIIFKDLSKDDAYVISERIRKNIETTSTIWSGGNIFVTVSGGVSSYPADGKTRDDIIKIADDILYSQCKRKGKNKVCAYQFLEESAISIDHT